MIPDSREFLPWMRTVVLRRWLPRPTRPPDALSTADPNRTTVSARSKAECCSIGAASSSGCSCVPLAIADRMRGAARRVRWLFVRNGRRRTYTRRNRLRSKRQRPLRTRPLPCGSYLPLAALVPLRVLRLDEEVARHFQVERRTELRAVERIDTRLVRYKRHTLACSPGSSDKLML